MMLITKNNSMIFYKKREDAEAVIASWGELDPGDVWKVEERPRGYVLAYYDNSQGDMFRVGTV